MNVEELHELATAMLDEIREAAMVQNLTQLRDALNNSINTPNDKNAQNAVHNQRTELVAAFSSAPSTDWPPRWHELVQVLGASDLLGPALADEVDAAFRSNQITPQVVAELATERLSEVEEHESQLQHLLSAHGHLGIDAYALGVGEFEVTVTIPRAAVDNGLGELGKEFQALERVLRPFVELAAGSPPPLQLRAISSSEFEAFVALLPEAAQYVSQTINWILIAYERVRGMREKRTELEELGANDEVLQALEDNANSLMADEIPKIVERVMDGARNLPSDGRENEIEGSLTRSVTEFSRRIDQEFRITVRTGPAPEPTEDAEDSTESQALDVGVEEARQVVLENQRRAMFHELPGQPILHLDSGDEGGSSS